MGEAADLRRELRAVMEELLQVQTEVEMVEWLIAARRAPRPDDRQELIMLRRTLPGGWVGDRAFRAALRAEGPEPFPVACGRGAGKAAKKALLRGD